jgi:hypothetical protein
MPSIHIGGEQAEFFTLTVHGRSLPHATDYWDGNWLACTAEVAAGAFRGTMDRLIRNEDLARFLHDLERMAGGQDVWPCLEALEGWLSLRLVGDKRGRIEAKGELEDDPAGGNALEFRLSIDQTYLPPLVAQLRAVLAEFPVVGQPG